MKVLFFLENPQVEHNAKFRNNTSQDVREVINQAITGWTRWMTVHFDHNYQDRLLRIRHWLRQPPPGPAHKHDGLHLLFMINNLLSTWCYMLTQGASATRFANINFNDPGIPAPGTAHLLLDELQDEFLATHATDDPFPHLAFKEWLKHNTVIGYPAEDATHTPAARSSAPAAAREHLPQVSAPPAAREHLPPVTLAPQTQPSRTAVKICPFHAAFIRKCPDSKVIVKPCRFGELCIHPHIDPGTLKVSEVSAACSSLLYAGPFMDSIITAAAKHLSPL